MPKKKVVDHLRQRSRTPAPRPQRRAPHRAEEARVIEDCAPLPQVWGKSLGQCEIRSLVDKNHGDKALQLLG